VWITKKRIQPPLKYINLKDGEAETSSISIKEDEAYSIGK
jgi:hypothetical protein